MTYQHLRTESDVRAVAMENPEGQPVRFTPQAVYDIACGFARFVSEKLQKPLEQLRIAVAQDAEGHYGPVFRKSITPSLSGISPISDLGFVTADAGTQSTPVMLRAVTPAAPLKRTAHVVR